MQDYAGTIVIGAKVNTKGATKDIENLYQKIEKEQNRIERLLERKKGLDINIEGYKNKIEEASTKTEELSQQLENIAKDQLEINGLPQTIENIQKMKEELSSFDLEPTGDRMSSGWFSTHLQAEKYQEIEKEFNKYVDKIDEANSKLDLAVQKQGRISREIQQATANQAELNQKLNEAVGKSGFDLGGLEKGFSKIIKKVGKIAMALVGVRTIINLITRSFNTLTEYNEELGTKMEQMRLVLAVALEPVINYIVSLLEIVLNIIDKIYTALFGISLYGRANELWSQKMAKNMASGAGSAKEMRKQLAGFDEMNVLNDNVAGAGGGGGFDMQDFILPDTPIPKGLQWIMDNGEPLGAIMGGVAGGALLMVDGLTRLHFALQEYENDPTLENFGEVVHRAGEAWAGFGMLAIDPVSTIAGSIMAISGILTNHKAEVDKWVGDITSNIYGQADWLSSNVSSTMGTMWENVGKDIEGGKEDFFDFMTEAQGDFDSLGRTIELFKEGDIKGAWNEIVSWLSKKWEFEKTRFEKNLNRIITNISNVVEGIKTDLGNLWKWIEDNLLKPIVDGWNKSWNAIKTIVSMAINHVVGEFWRIVGIIDNVGLTIAEFIGGAVRGVVNGALTFAENRINDFIRMINNVVGIINKIPGVNIGRIGYVSLPRMAVGGIINQPGRGVPVGGAIAGESGREGILPLTDKQAMAELGREIGKWISIQAIVPVNIGNRQVARVIQELNNDREFAMNS